MDLKEFVTLAFCVGAYPASQIYGHFKKHEGDKWPVDPELLAMQEQGKRDLVRVQEITRELIAQDRARRGLTSQASGPV